MWQFWQSLDWSSKLNLVAFVGNVITWVILGIVIRTQREIDRQLNPQRRRRPRPPEL
jgi:hypothetical protein